MQDSHEKKFLAAYDALSDAIYRHCYFRVFSKARAEELTQDTFLRAWEYLISGKSIENMKPFLYRIATNLIIDDSRKSREESLDRLTGDETAPFDPPSDDHIAMEHQVLFNQIGVEMRRLSPDTRELLVMRYVDDLEPKEIAEILDMTANNVSVKINRALKELKRFIT